MRLALALHVLALAVLLSAPSPASSQTAPVVESCLLEARSLTGAWTTTETTDGQNMSFWRGALRLVHRGEEVVGRWEPPGGAPERAVIGTFAGGVLRLAVRGTPAQPAADVAASAPRTLVLTLSRDGTLLTGRWSEPAGASGQDMGTPAPTSATARQGDFVATGEAGCRPAGAAVSGTMMLAAPAAAEIAAPLPGSATVNAGGTGAVAPGAPPCARWDLSGTWIVAGRPDDRTAWQLRLWQDGDSVLGWYELAGTPPAGPAAAEAPAWVVDGTLRGRTLLLQHVLGDSAAIARTLVLSPEGTALAGAWPLPFGPEEREVLRGHARCVG